ncbi:Ubiquinone/menaquinone biosynthesis C-methyltransferase UbiE [uncultured archaeon]|nr:Ubiquinone/menaquinone biosynthesis C-methyltransferase UbiE [uncultured archaeon]
MSEIQMAEAKRIERGGQCSGSQQGFGTQRPKIETIMDINIETVRATLLDAVCGYLKNVNPGEDEKRQHWLDCATECLDIPHIAAACRKVNPQFRHFAMSGVAALMKRENDPAQYGMNRDLLAKLAERSPLVRERMKGHVLDFGCGVGWLTKLLRDEFGSDSIGIDVDEGAITLGRFFGATGLIQMDKDAEGLPFPDGKLDAVVIKEVFDVACWSETNILDEAHRVTRPDGVLLTSEFYSQSLRRMFAEHGFKAVCGGIACWTAWKKTRQDVR